MVKVKKVGSKTAKQKRRRQNDFTGMLWKAVRATNTSAELMSPVGFGVFMTLVKVGARGPAAEEISSTLLFSNDAAIAQRYMKVLKSLEGWKTDGIQLTIYSTICGPTEVAFHEDFVEFAEDKFKTEIKNVNYAKPIAVVKEINENIDKATKHVLTSTLKNADVGSKSNLVLVNAVCFKGLFKNNYRFKAQHTKKETFYNLNGTTTEVDMMCGTADFMYGRLEDMSCSAIGIPYEGGNYSLMMVLPDALTGLSDLEQSLDANFFNLIRSKMKWSNRVFTAKLPKFKITSKVDFVAVLKSIGIKTMFNVKADLQGYFGQGGTGHFTKVFQQCSLELSEKGSEGSGAHSGFKLISGAVKFEANHPFLFFITDEKNDEVVMVGCKANFD